MSQSPRERLTDAQVDLHLRRIFADVELMMSGWTDGSLTPEVEAGSSLSGDDARTDPEHMSHAVTQLTTVAVDQLHALRALMLDAGVLHNYAPFTLARSAIEVAATALWMLAPPDRSARVRRRMIHAAQDATDGTTMAKGAGIAVPRELSVRLAQLEALASAAAGSPVKLPRLTITRVMEDVDRLQVSAMGVLDAWRIGSGFAHGRRWAALGVLEREVLPAREPGIAQLRLTNRSDAVLWVTWTAHDLIRATLRLFEQRARSPYRST
ncbi:MAG: hypothetical protein JWO98_4791 [Frankiales bacterium]|nr:hypothetical protein [Frankiales bacterium]